MHLKRKRTATRLFELRRVVVRRRLMRALFGHQRFLDDVINIHRTQFDQQMPIKRTARSISPPAVLLILPRPHEAGRDHF